MDVPKDEIGTSTIIANYKAFGFGNIFDPSELMDVSSAEISRIAIPDSRKITIAVPPKPIYENPAAMNLPISCAKDLVLGAIARRSVSIIIGATGSGKSTQVPQFLLEESRETSEPCSIICAQPRRIAAISLAKRVAEERGEPLGVTVGFIVRHESCVSPKTLLTFCTYGVLLKMLRDGKTFPFVILDEVHERNLNCDLILMKMKNLMEPGEKMKLLLMSATPDLSTLTKLFPKCLVVEVPGRTLFDVTIYYIEGICQALQYNEVQLKKALESARTYDCELTINLLKHLLTSNKCGTAIVFLPGLQAITETKSKLDLLKRYWPAVPLRVVTLHSTTKAEESAKLWQYFDGSTIILSTNIAETSLTIPEVQVVIDAGLEKLSFEDESGYKKLVVQWISKSSANQRCGRAGRVKAGMCFRLYSKETFEAFEPNPTPEIHRVGLAKSILDLKTAAEPETTVDQLFANAPDLPKVEQLAAATSLLKRIGVLDKEEKMTVLGQYVSRLSIGPQFGVSIVMATFLKCLDPVLTIVCFLDQKEMFFDSRADVLKHEKTRDTVQKLMKNTQSDHFLLLEIVKQHFEVFKKVEEFDVLKEFLTHKEFLDIDKTKNQIIRQLKELGLTNDTTNSNSSSWPAVKAALVAGNWTKISKTTDPEHIILKDGKTAKLKSYRSLEPTSNLVLWESVQSTPRNDFARCITPITSTMVFFVVGSIWMQNEGVDIKLDEYFNFKLKPSLADTLQDLKGKFEAMFLHFLQHPNSSACGPLLKVVIEILRAEDEASGLGTPMLEVLTRYGSVSEGSVQHVGAQDQTDAEEGQPPKKKTRRSGTAKKARRALHAGEPLLPEQLVSLEARSARRLQKIEVIALHLTEVSELQHTLLQLDFSAMPLATTIKEEAINMCYEITTWLNTKNQSHPLECIKMRMGVLKKLASILLDPQQHDVWRCVYPY